MSEKTINVIFADDHNLVRKGIISLLDDVEEILVVDEAVNGYELVEKYRMLKPDIVISDISMPDLSGTDAAKLILEFDHDAKILFLSMYSGDDYVVMVLNSGGFGLINKSIAKDELVTAIKTVYNGGRYFGPGYDEEKLEYLLKNYKITVKEKESIIEELTGRELETLKLVCEGLSVKEISDKLNISNRTVESHKLNIMKKFGVTTSTQLIKYALKNQLI